MKEAESIKDMRIRDEPTPEGSSVSIIEYLVKWKDCPELVVVCLTTCKNFYNVSSSLVIFILKMSYLTTYRVASLPETRKNWYKFSVHRSQNRAKIHAPVKFTGA